MADRKDVEFDEGQAPGKDLLLESHLSPEKEVAENGQLSKKFEVQEKRDIIEVPEVDYQNNETCVIGDLSEEEEEVKPIIPEAANITPYPSSIINLVSLPPNQAPLSIAPILEENEVCETTSEESAERLGGLINDQMV